MCCSEQKPIQEDKRRLQTKSPKAKQTKVVLVGDQAVGKSSLSGRICNQQFQDTYDLTLGGLYNKTEIVSSDGQNHVIHLWDTAGEESFRSMLSMYYQGAKAVIVVYDITKESSFRSIKEYWLNELQERIDKDKLILVLVGNKCDLEMDRVVQTNTVLNFAKSHDMGFVEASAKSGEGIQQLLKILADKL